MSDLRRPLSAARSRRNYCGGHGDVIGPTGLRSVSHHVLQLGGVDELLEIDQLAVAHGEHVAVLGVKVLSRGLACSGVAPFDNDAVAGVVEGLWGG